MAAINREKVLERRKRFEAKQAKFKAAQEKLRKEKKQISAILKKQGDMKLMIIGRIMLEKMNSDPELKSWFHVQINQQLIKEQERGLFALAGS